MCRLALAMGKSLSEIATMPPAEFTTWLAYYQLEPFGCPAHDGRANAQMQLFFSANAKPGTPVPNFFKRWEPAEDIEAAPPPKETLQAKIKAFFAPKIKKANPQDGNGDEQQINTEAPAE